MLTTLDHVIVAVRDLEAARAGYTRLLGRTPSWTGNHPEAGSANVLWSLDNTYLELLAPAGDGPVGALLDAWLATHDQGPLGLAFGTEDAAACHRMLADHGLAPGDPEPGGGIEATTGALRQWTRVPLALDRTRGVVLFAIQHRSPADALPPAQARGDERACVAGLDHAVVRTPNAEGARALYEDGLGLRLALDRSFDDWGVRLMFFRVGGITVEVAAALGEGDADTVADTDHFWGLSWRVPDADAARERLAGLGFDVSEVRTGRRPGTRVLTVRDGTCGVATLMIEVTPPSA